MLQKTLHTGVKIDQTKNKPKNNNNKRMPRGKFPWA